jgi:alanine racemase
MAAFIEKNCPNLFLEGIFTHLPVSDDRDPAYTRLQIQRFQDVVAAIQAAIGRRVDLVHCANSGGVLGHEPGWLDMVRPGIMIYGFYPDAGTPRTIPLKPGLSFLTRVSFIKKISAGTSVGYGRTWFAPRTPGLPPCRWAMPMDSTACFPTRGRVLIRGNPTRWWAGCALTRAWLTWRGDGRDGGGRGGV